MRGLRVIFPASHEYSQLYPLIYHPTRIFALSRKQHPQSPASPALDSDGDERTYWIYNVTVRRNLSPLSVNVSMKSEGVGWLFRRSGASEWLRQSASVATIR